MIHVAEQERICSKGGFTAPFRVLLYYHYARVRDPEQLRRTQQQWASRWGLRGRIIVSPEGLNGTLSGQPAACEAYMRALWADARFADMVFKVDQSPAHAFSRLRVQLRQEMVHAARPDIDMQTVPRGPYIGPQDFRKHLSSLSSEGSSGVSSEGLSKVLSDVSSSLSSEGLSGVSSDVSSDVSSVMSSEGSSAASSEVLLLDVRSRFEHALGRFKGAYTLPIDYFREFFACLGALDAYRQKTIITYCTGGVRCEKATAFLRREGFASVYQLRGGILGYGFETDGYGFEGSCYVFDERLTVPINRLQEKVLASCYRCGRACERMINCANPSCNRHIPLCEGCGWRWAGACSSACQASPSAAAL